jgi:SPOR domain
MDPDVRRMGLFAGGLGSVLAVLIGISALTGRHSGEVPVVAADERPLRVKPADPGGMKINAAENDVFSGGSDTGKARLGPAAENPDTAALRTAATDTTPADQASAPAPASDASPAPVVQATPKASPAPAVQAAPKAPPASVAQSTPKAPPAPVAQSMPKAPPSAASKPVAAPAPAAPAPTARSATVQLAALTSEQAARTEWQALVKRIPDLLASRQPSFSHVEHDGHTFWRVRTSGFADVAQARGFCEKVRTKGVGCSVTEF